MPQFPILRTGAVAQYPLQSGPSYSTRIARFVDGNEQRAPEFAQPLRRWVVQLTLLDESELSAIESFFRLHWGSNETFSFTDPGNSQTYPECSIEGDDLEWHQYGYNDARTRIIIRENGV